jgi:hypothetical protein
VRASLTVVALWLAGAALAAQETKAPATKADTKAPVTKASETKAPATKAQDAKAPATKSADTKAPATKAQDTKTAAAPTQTKQDTKAAATKTATPAGNTKTPAGGTRPALAVAPEAPPRVEVPVIMREQFDYDAGGRRDPFFSLLGTAELRPTVADLRLVGILYDESGRRPVAIMRDLQTNTQYRVTTGMTLGRLRVALIKRRAVIFSIEEFGLNRQDSLVLGDTSRARAR